MKQALKQLLTELEQSRDAFNIVISAARQSQAIDTNQLVTLIGIQNEFENQIAALNNLIANA